VDPHGGLHHLTQRRLVAIAESNLLEDPLRLLRGIRLANELGFQLDPTSEAWIQRHRQQLQTVAGERVLAELEKLAHSPAGEQGLLQCLHWGLLSPWQGGEPCRSLSQLNRTQAEAIGLSENDADLAVPLARLAAVLEAPGLKALRSSRKLQQRVERLRRWRSRLALQQPAEAAEALPEAERLQLHLELEHDLPALLLSWPCEAAQAWLRRWSDGGDPLFHPKPAIDGLTLQRQLGLKASPQLGAGAESLAPTGLPAAVSDAGARLRQAQRRARSAAEGGAMAAHRATGLGEGHLAVINFIP